MFKMYLRFDNSRVSGGVGEMHLELRGDNVFVEDR